jgi:hypothetical protein
MIMIRCNGIEDDIVVKLSLSLRMISSLNSYSAFGVVLLRNNHGGEFLTMSFNLWKGSVLTWLSYISHWSHLEIEQPCCCRDPSISICASNFNDLLIMAMSLGIGSISFTCFN